MRLSDYKILTFDCYGTLIDWESGIMAALQPLLARLATQPSREEILQAHARCESVQQRQTPTMRYRDLLAVVYKRLAEGWGVPARWSDCEAYGRSVGRWPAFPDTVTALRYLKQHYRLVILSNVDNATFAESNETLGIEFDAILTAEDAGAYKPNPRNFNYLLETIAGFGWNTAEILHTAESLFHDHAPANEIGIASCWIHRQHSRTGFGATMDPGPMPNANFRFTSLGEMAEAHRRERL